MLNTLFLPEIREMLAENKQDELREICGAIHPAAIADLMGDLTADEAWQVLRYADSPVRVEIFNYFDPDRQLELLHNQDRNEVALVIGGRGYPQMAQICTDWDYCRVKRRTRNQNE